MKMFISFLMMMISLFILFLNHPLSMGLMILIQTLLTCLISGMLIKTYWFSYILFLVFLGGLLVLFIYVTSIASNEIFLMNLNSKINLFFMFMFIFLLILFNMFFNKLNYLYMNFNADMYMQFEKYIFFNNEFKINLSKMYNTQTFFNMIMLFIYLFITLLAVVKITNIFYGPLRMMN